MISLLAILKKPEKASGGEMSFVKAIIVKPNHSNELKYNYRLYTT
jgi:hypothetical protein